MSYAVIQLQGKQHKVSVGDKVTIAHLEREDDVIKVKDVLLYADGDKVEVGTPLVANKTVTLKAVADPKSDKIRVAKFRSKSRYRRVYGHRQLETLVEVVSIA